MALSELGDHPRTGKGRLEIAENGEQVLKLNTFEVFGSKLINLDKPRSR
ncbi:MAG: hypothetical protein QM736_06280 [Vicinamibacterales bacterium]